MLQRSIVHLKAKTTTDGARLYKPGDLIDYHRVTTTKDEHGGWNGPYPVVRNEPERGQVICKAGAREIAVQYPDARLTLFIEIYFTKELKFILHSVNVVFCRNVDIAFCFHFLQYLLQ